MSSIMQLDPVINPMITIGDSSLSYDMEKNVFCLDTPDKEYELTAFEFTGWPTAVQRLSTCLSFMSAAAEAQNAVDQGRFSDNADIFEPDIMRWCQENASEIITVLCELDG